MKTGTSWKDDYQRKLVKPEEAAGKFRSGDRILMAPANSAPEAIVKALCDRRQELEEVELYSSLLTCPYNLLEKECTPHIEFFSNYIGPFERFFMPEGNVTPFPIHLSLAGRLIRANTGAGSFMCEVSPPDENGYMNFGPSGTIYGRVGVEIATQVMVQVNRRTPRVHGSDNVLHVSEADWIVEADHDLIAIPEIPVTDIERRIGSLIAEQIPDGATVQLGIGGIPSAIAYSLEHKKDLGIHTEAMSDAVAHLYEKGVITGRKKTLHPGKIVVGGVIVGSQKLYDFVDDNPDIMNMPIEYVNNFQVISSQDNFISINAALSVDLTGQVASESIGHNQYSCTGGQLDFVRGSQASSGGKSFIALNSTTARKDGSLISRIVLDFKPGTVVTTPRSDVMYAVTEYGIADLYLKPIPERIAAMISIAHPDFREQLERDAYAARLLKRKLFPAGMQEKEPAQLAG